MAVTASWGSAAPSHGPACPVGPRLPFDAALSDADRAFGRVQSRLAVVGKAVAGFVGGVDPRGTPRLAKTIQRLPPNDKSQEDDQ